MVAITPARARGGVLVTAAVGITRDGDAGVGMRAAFRAAIVVKRDDAGDVDAVMFDVMVREGAATNDGVVAIVVVVMDDVNVGVGATAVEGIFFFFLLKKVANAA
jgi:hypothetical protein